MTSIVKSIINSLSGLPIDPFLLAVLAILIPGIIVFLIMAVNAIRACCLF